jgi:uncharacterized membrane protein
LLQADVVAWPPTPTGSALEESVVNAVHWLRLLVEVTGAIVIGLGVLAAAYALATTLIGRRGTGFLPIRLLLARYLVLALEFQLAADILSTAVAPSWDEIGKLGAIAVIRTTLNFFLIRELREASEVRAAEAG